MIMNKEVAICDLCKDRIADSIKIRTKIEYLKCDICGKHVCDNCYDEHDIEFCGKEINKLLLCNDCETEIDNSKIKIDKENTIKNIIIGQFKKIFILNKL